MHGPLNIKLERYGLWHSPKDTHCYAAQTAAPRRTFALAVWLKSSETLWTDCVYYIKSECVPQREHSLIAIQKSVSILTGRNGCSLWESHTHTHALCGQNGEFIR